MTNEITKKVEELVKNANGKVWEKDGKYRVYFSAFVVSENTQYRDEVKGYFDAIDNSVVFTGRYCSRHEVDAKEIFMTAFRNGVILNQSKDEYYNLQQAKKEAYKAEVETKREKDGISKYGWKK